LLRLAVVVGYVVAVAALVAVALVSGSGDVAAFRFIGFGVISVVFGYAGALYGPRMGNVQPVRTRVFLGVGVVMAALPSSADAAFPGRDGLIAFTRAVGSEPGQIYVVRPNGTGLRQITHRRRGAGAPAWSPDGRRLAFGGNDRKGRVHVIVKRLGGRVRQITHGNDLFTDPAWSPDGRRIAVRRLHWDKLGYSHESIVVMRADGRRRQVVYGPDTRTIGTPAFSPDGQTIAFGRTDTDIKGADLNIYVMPAGGGTPRLITEGDWQDHPDWSPDGSLIAYTYGAFDDVRVMRPDGTGDAPITDDLAGDSRPSWAPSGGRLVIGRLGHIWTVAPDGSDLRQITRGGPPNRGDFEPSWQRR
jgi:dipeptidyl aminopeptidase/acylaminoacyl peptidase